jgi:hypothetical protein
MLFMKPSKDGEFDLGKMMETELLRPQERGETFI